MCILGQKEEQALTPGHTRCESSSHKGHVLYDSTDAKCLEQGHPETERRSVVA